MNARNKYITKVIACPDCKGAGEILKDPGIRSNTYDVVECPSCKGTGRLIRKTKVEYTPYDKDVKLMVKI
jgi:DnaJ-class molecular chaperone